jgi:hypothetical protein
MAQKKRTQMGTKDTREGTSLTVKKGRATKEGRQKSQLDSNEIIDLRL